MQDLQSIGVVSGGGGRFFGGGVGDRRLRVHDHSLALIKCPRCDSLNTKFCYYNNYNLSQPRHFCKACRRYWTKGGVLRSVPVGGGCRKSKRSKSKSGTGDDGSRSRERKSKSQSPSSADSSSLTAATHSSAAAEEGSAASESATKYGFSGAMFYDTNNPKFDDHGCQAPLMNNPTSADGQIFAEIGSFDGLMASSSDNAASMIGFSMADIPTTSYDGMPRAPAADHAGPEVEELKMHEMNNDELTVTLDWGSCGGVSGGDQSMFDLTAALDPSYWSQPQWTGHPISPFY